MVSISLKGKSSNFTQWPLYPVIGAPKKKKFFYNTSQRASHDIAIGHRAKWAPKPDSILRDIGAHIASELHLTFTQLLHQSSDTFLQITQTQLPGDIGFTEKKSRTPSGSIHSEFA